jgi:hypothetical protein
MLPAPDFRFVGTIYIVFIRTKYYWTAQSVQRLATGWTVRGSNPGGGEIFRTRPSPPWSPPSLLYNGYRGFPEVKRPGRGVDHTPPSSAEVRGSVVLYVYSLSGPSWPVLGRPLPLLTKHCWDDQIKGNEIGREMSVMVSIFGPIP